MTNSATCRLCRQLIVGPVCDPALYAKLSADPRTDPGMTLLGYVIAHVIAQHGEIVQALFPVFQLFQIVVVSHLAEAGDTPDHLWLTSRRLATERLVTMLTSPNPIQFSAPSDRGNSPAGAILT